MKSGFLVSFEGVDGSGKSTQATMLYDRFIRENFPALIVREPGGTDLSEQIRSILLDTTHAGMAASAEFLLYAASRAQLVAEKIKPALNQGKVVICDRFSDSSLAYQGFGRGVDKTFIQRTNMQATQNILPDITFIVDIDINTAQKRALQNNQSPDRLEGENKRFKIRVRDGYRRIANETSDRVILLQGTQSIELLHESIWEKVMQRLKSKRVVTR
ncbi:MAG TPA: dTMP kinase [bacterium]|nr:dTMP kinase [bacterium]